MSSKRPHRPGLGSTRCLRQGARSWFVTEQLQKLSSMETLLRIVQRAGEQGLLHVAEYLARHRSMFSAAES